MRTSFKHGIAPILRRAALAVALAAGGGVASAAAVHVAIDTSTFGVASGFLDLQFSASAGVPLATAVVSNMVGFDSHAFIDSWGVASSGGGYVFRNDTSNDLFHAVSFGGVLSFDLNIAGEHDPLTSYVSRFVVSAYDGASTPLGAFNPVTGALADFSWTPALTAQGEGSLGVAYSDPGVSVGPVVPVIPSVPEPSTWLLMAAGLAAIALRAPLKGCAKTLR